MLGAAVDGLPLLRRPLKPCVALSSCRTCLTGETPFGVHLAAEMRRPLRVLGWMGVHWSLRGAATSKLAASTTCLSPMTIAACIEGDVAERGRSTEITCGVMDWMAEIIASA